MKRRDFFIGALTTFVLPTTVFASTDTLLVNRTKSCGCCGEWVERMSSSGFRTKVNFVNDETLRSIKTQLGIPAELSSCHTATINKYVIEGHVPARDIKRLLVEKPKARGLSVPGMPIGSPGMEMGNKKEPFDTLLILYSGATEVFSRHI